MKPTTFIRLTLLAVPFCYFSQATAHDGTVNITGSILDNTCSVSSDSKNISVVLGNVDSRQFDTAGAGARYEPFTIHLENCGAAASRLRVTFSGIADAASPQLLAVTAGTGSAQGVGIGIYDTSKTLIPLNTAGEDTPLTANQSSVSLPFFARYVADGQTVTTGPANATTTFSLAYD